MISRSSALRVPVDLPRGSAEFIVDPAELAPWTADFWRYFPSAAAPRHSYVLRAEVGGGLRIETPGETIVVAPETAAQTWDNLMRTVLRRRLGPAIVHGALVIGPGGGLLLAGPSGSGKTTLLLELVARGFCYAGDDLVRIDREGLHGVPRCLEWDRATDAPLDTHPFWSYRTPASGQAHGFGHLAARLHRTPVAWSDLRAAVLLETERRARPRLTPAHPSGEAVWINPPRLRDGLRVLRLYRRPWWRLWPGRPAETAGLLASAFLDYEPGRTSTV